MASLLYPHKQTAFDHMLSHVDNGHPWILIEGSGSSTGTSFLMTHLTKQLPRQGYQSLYVEAAPIIESSYPISQQIIKMFDTKAQLMQKSTFHQAIEHLRRYNFSPLYILCDLSITQEQSSISLLKEAEFLYRHSPKNQLRFIFSKNWNSLGYQPNHHKDPTDQHSPSQAQSFRNKGKQIWQVIKVDHPELVDIQIHVDRYLNRGSVNYQIHPDFYEWISEMVGFNFTLISSVLDDMIKQSQIYDLKKNGSCYLELSFMKKHASNYLKEHHHPSAA